MLSKMWQLGSGVCLGGNVHENKRFSLWFWSVSFQLSETCEIYLAFVFFFCCCFVFDERVKNILK